MQGYCKPARMPHSLITRLIQKQTQTNAHFNVANTKKGFVPNLIFPLI